MRNHRLSLAKSTKCYSGFICMVALTLTFCFKIAAQQSPAQQSPAQQSQAPSADPKQQRHEQIQADATRLLQLASELKAEVDKSTKDTLSVPVVKKADEVGKLAKKLREEMKP